MAVPTNTTIITIGTPPNSIIPEIIADETLEVTVANLQLTKLANHDFSAMVGNKGDTVKIPNLTGITTAIKTPDVKYTPIPISSTVSSIVLEQQIGVPLLIEDTAEMFASIQLRNQLIMNSGKALAEAIETFVWQKVIASKAPIPTTIDLALFRTLRTNFATNKVPALDPRFFIVGPTGYDLLYDIDEFTHAETIGSNIPYPNMPFINGVVPKVLTFYTFENQTAPTGPDTAVAFISNAIAVLTRPLSVSNFGVQQVIVGNEETNIPMRLTMQYSALDSGLIMNMEALIGAGAANTDWLEVITY